MGSEGTRRRIGRTRIYFPPAAYRKERPAATRPAGIIPRAVHPMAHEISVPATARRRVIRVLLYLGSSALAALALAAGLRELLPYERLRSTTPEERFFLWEGVMWMLGLVMLFFGATAGLGALHLGDYRLPSMDEFLARMRTPGRPRPSLLPWWMVCTGALLILLAVQARARLPG
jgi:hypothetical protein